MMSLLFLLPAALDVGVTLHAYHSWAEQVARGTTVKVHALLPAGVDAASYQPRPQEVERIAGLDLVLVNGIGHDGFVDALLAAAGNTKLQIVRPGDELALMKGAHGEAVNPHTFLSFGLAIQQVHAIARALAERAPEHAAAFHANARAYAQRLRALHRDTERRLAGARTRRVVTVHDGYGYLLDELGLEVVAVVEPAHGVVPSAKELAILVELLKREKVEVLLTEARFPPAMVALLESQAGVRVGTLSHVASGEYTAEKFEVEMKANADVLVAMLAGPRS